MQETMERKMAKALYDREHTRAVKLKLNTKTDADILAKLDAMADQPGGKQGYIKRLIREDLKKQD